jgi:uncharacterized protein (TIGR01319 family)
MDSVLTVDFGSTYTKAALIDLGRNAILGTAYAPSTVGTDVVIGLKSALEGLATDTGVDVSVVPALACSSAAGGLRIVVVGLVPSLSLEAAQRAALGAGAKIVGAYGFKITTDDIVAIERARPDIVLLAGGTDGGDTETILYNARALAATALAAPFIVAGNREVTPDCVAILEATGRRALTADNILPEVDRVAVEPVHRIIRELFMTHITRAKGIDRVCDVLNLIQPIVPTPSAVLEAARLLAEGADDEEGLGDLVVVDVGGATTDVHSVAHGGPTRPGVVLRGLPELYLKRTVEGDLGLRVNAPTILERVAADDVIHFARSLNGESDKIEELDVATYVERIGRSPEHVPSNRSERALDAALGRTAVELAVVRHAGALKEVFTTTGTVLVQEGKDLSQVATVIGVGGVLSRGICPRFVLEGALKTAERPFSLRPERARFLIDRSYVLYGVGLLAGLHPASALRLARATLLAV